jgi:hypothetical protein
MFELVDATLLIIKKCSKSFDELLIRSLDPTINDMNVCEFLYDFRSIIVGLIADAGMFGEIISITKAAYQQLLVSH